MSKAQDIRLTEGDDLFVTTDGDFDITESDTQHVDTIIDSWVGHWKEFPTVGVGIKRKLAQSGNIQKVSREIKIQLTADGYNVKGIQIVNGEVYVTGKRDNEDI
jgi:hypothetical protein